MTRQTQIIGRFAPPGAASLWIMRALALIGFAISTYLMYVSIKGGSVVGCGGLSAFDCEHVLGTRWSMWLGKVPVSLAGVLVYGGALALLCLEGPGASRRHRTFIWALLIMLCSLAAVSAVWFTMLQFVVMRFESAELHVCPYCLGVHACGLVLASMAFLLAPIDRSVRRGEGLILGPGSVLGSAGVGVAGVVVLIFGQLLIEPKSHQKESADVVDLTNATSANPITSIITSPAFSPPPKPAAAPKSTPIRSYEFLKGKLKLKSSSGPVIGPSDSANVVAMMLDYTCSHCRQTYNYLQLAMKRFRGRLSVLLLPVPLDPECNPALPDSKKEPREGCEYARLALAVWKAKPQVFDEFSQWLVKSEARDLKKAEAKAESLVGKQTLKRALDETAINSIIQNNVKLYAAMKRRTLPKIITAKSVTHGQPSSARELLKILKEDLGLITLLP